MTSLRAAVLLLITASPASKAAVNVLIQPGQNHDSVVWTVSWDSLAGNIARPVIDLGFMNPATGQPQANYLYWVRQAGWAGIGEPFGDVYSRGGDYGFWDGAFGVESSVPGWCVCPAASSYPNWDALYIFNYDLDTEGDFPATGGFTLTVPGDYISYYNVGTYHNNPNVTVTVTTTPAPEPSTVALAGAALAAGLMRRKRQRSGGSDKDRGNA